MNCSTPGFPVFHYLWSLLKLISIESVMPSISSSVVPFSSHLQSFPASGAFPVSQFFTSDRKYWSFSFSISPSNEYSELISLRIDWFDLLAVQGTFQESSPAPQFKNINSLHSAFFMVQLFTSICDYWENRSFDSMDRQQQ